MEPGIRVENSGMSEITPSEHIIPCANIERVKMTDERRTLEKVGGQTPFAIFSNWANHEARHMCERGSCVSGTCRGHVDVSDWRLVEDDEERFTCEFTAEFYCRCE
jgi:hypothetical protein